jgi:hypothetical protein
MATKKDETPDVKPSGITSAFAEKKEVKTSEEAGPGKRIFRFITMILVGVVILWLLISAWRFFFPAPEWEQTIMVTPNFPQTHRSVTSDGKCNSNPILVLFRYVDEEADAECLTWETMDGWKEAGLEIRLKNGRRIRKAIGDNLDNTVLDAVVDLRSTDGKIHYIKFKMRCPCRE